MRWGKKWIIKKEFLQNNGIKTSRRGRGSWSCLQIALFSSPPPSQLAKGSMLNRDKQEAHLSLPRLHTKTTKAEEETHWVLETVWYALSLQLRPWRASMYVNECCLHSHSIYRAILIMHNKSGSPLHCCDGSGMFGNGESELNHSGLRQIPCFNVCARVSIHARGLIFFSFLASYTKKNQIINSLCWIWSTDWWLCWVDKEQHLKSRTDISLKEKVTINGKFCHYWLALVPMEVSESVKPLWSFPATQCSPKQLKYMGTCFKD